MATRRPDAPKVTVLPYRKLQQGRDYWILDQALPNPQEVRARLLASKDWKFGWPYREHESWPGMRAQNALLPEELERLEAWVRAQTGAQRLWQVQAEGGATLAHNCVQLVGEGESGLRPHTDSRKECRYAGVLYLSPNVPPSCGTSFFRVRMPKGPLGGNTVPYPHAHLVEALRTSYVSSDMFVEDLRVDYQFNRLLLYRAEIIHSATRYYGEAMTEKRMTVVFFWMA